MLETMIFKHDWMDCGDNENPSRWVNRAVSLEMIISRPFARPLVQYNLFPAAEMHQAVAIKTSSTEPFAFTANSLDRYCIIIN